MTRAGPGYRTHRRAARLPLRYRVKLLSADALLSLLNDILDFSKIEAGRIDLDPIDFLLRDSIGDTLSPLALRAAGKGVELAYDVHPEVPDALIGDVYRLRQILVNLAGNAIKFTERGEVVYLYQPAGRVRLADEVVLEVTVGDTGIGISPEAAARLFVAFEQAETSTTRKYGGTGLGLAISKQLIELMGGQIRPGEHARSRKHVHLQCALQGWRLPALGGAPWRTPSGPSTASPR